MHIDFHTTTVARGSYLATIETEEETKAVADVIGVNLNDADDTQHNFLAPGNGRYFNLIELHKLVQKGVTLTGLPDWLSIK